MEREGGIDGGGISGFRDETGQQTESSPGAAETKKRNDWFQAAKERLVGRLSRRLTKEELENRNVLKSSRMRPYAIDFDEASSAVSLLLKKRSTTASGVSADSSSSSSRSIPSVRLRVQLEKQFAPDTAKFQPAEVDFPVLSPRGVHSPLTVSEDAEGSPSPRSPSISPTKPETDVSRRRTAWDVNEPPAARSAKITVAVPPDAAAALIQPAFEFDPSDALRICDSLVSKGLVTPDEVDRVVELLGNNDPDGARKLVQSFVVRRGINLSTESKTKPRIGRRATVSAVTSSLRDIPDYVSPRDRSEPEQEDDAEIKYIDEALLVAQRIALERDKLEPQLLRHIEHVCGCLKNAKVTILLSLPYMFIQCSISSPVTATNPIQGLQH